MTLAARRPLLVAVGVAVLLIAGATTYFALSTRGDSAARDAAERYLQVLSNDGQDPVALVDLVSVEDPSALERANALLAASKERISEVSLGPSQEITTPRTAQGKPPEAATAHAASDVRFDRFERFEVSYRLAGDQHRATITLGLPRSGADDGWLVVMPLAGEVDWNSATWGIAPLDVAVGDVALTEVGRTTYEPDAQFVHPAVYPVRASVGPYFNSPETDLTVDTDTHPTPLPEFDLAPTAAGTAAITEEVRAAFKPCGRGTAYCPVIHLTEPRDDDLPEGWWRGLVVEPTVAVDGTAVTLRGGQFRYLGPAGLLTVAFDGATTVTIDPTTGRPGVAIPLDLTRR